MEFHDKAYMLVDSRGLSIVSSFLAVKNSSFSSIAVTNLNAESISTMGKVHVTANHLVTQNGIIVQEGDIDALASVARASRVENIHGLTTNGPVLRIISSSDISSSGRMM